MGELLWPTDTDGAFCVICKKYHFVTNCPNLKDQFESICSNLDTKIMSSNSLDGRAIADFIRKQTSGDAPLINREPGATFRSIHQHSDYQSFCLRAGKGL